MSSDGKYQTATVYGGSLYTSSNYGADWTQQPGSSRNYPGVAMSSDGKYQLAAVNGDYLYKSVAGMYCVSSQLGMKVGGVDQGSLLVKTSSVSNLVFRTITTPNSKAVRIEMTVQDARQDFSKTIKLYDTIVLRGTLH
jgi:hypothetical protein